MSLTCYGVLYLMLCCQEGRYLPSERRLSQVPMGLPCDSARRPCGSPAVSSPLPTDAPGQSLRGKVSPLFPWTCTPTHEEWETLKGFQLCSMTCVVSELGVGQWFASTESDVSWCCPPRAETTLLCLPLVALKCIYPQLSPCVCLGACHEWKVAAVLMPEGPGVSVGGEAGSPKSISELRLWAPCTCFCPTEYHLQSTNSKIKLKVSTAPK